MNFCRQYTVIVPLCAAISFLMASCQDTKTLQCNQIITIANDAVNQAREVTNSGQTNDPQAMIQAAEAMEQAAQEMENLELKDEKLQDYQVAFVSMYQDTSQATRNFVKAFEKKDRTAAESALLNLQQATAPEKKLVDGINTYCNGG